MIFALVSGMLLKPPEQRVGKNGRTFTVATIKIRDGEIPFARFIAFSESAQTELARLREGDAISIQGPLKAETYTASDGTAKVSLSFVAENVLALRQNPNP